MTFRELHLPYRYQKLVNCQIQIEYETSPESSALYWLTPDQTADGLYPFLLSNKPNTLSRYGRKMFPCQDTPSVKFTYTAEISVPNSLRVIMSAVLKNVYESGGFVVYEFSQTKPVPPSAVIIAVGSLQKRRLTERSDVYAENKFINDSVLHLGITESMLQIAESLCGPYVWERYDVCVLPPSIQNFGIECPCVAFISPTILYEDHTWVSLFVENIARSWAGNLVTCANYNNYYWLNNSFSKFIFKKIRKILFHNQKANDFFDKLELLNIHCTIGVTDLNNTQPISVNLPDSFNIQKDLPTEIGIYLLNNLERSLGGALKFELFLRSYFHNFAYKSITTQDWLDYLYQYFYDKKEILDGIEWNVWFSDTTLRAQYFLSLIPDLKLYPWEIEVHNIVEALINWNDETYNVSNILQYRAESLKYDFEKQKLLESLGEFLEEPFTRNSLTEKQLLLLEDFYHFDTYSGNMRFFWLILCLKARWLRKVVAALNFAIQFCSLNYACPIFECLYKWPEMRVLAIETYHDNKQKMLHETQNELEVILHLKPEFEDLPSFLELL